MMQETIPVALSLIVVLCTILVFFIVNSLKKIEKIDKIIRLEEKFEHYIKVLEDAIDQIKNLSSKSVNNDLEIIKLKEKCNSMFKRIEAIEDRIRSFDNGRKAK